MVCSSYNLDLGLISSHSEACSHNGSHIGRGRGREGRRGRGRFRKERREYHRAPAVEATLSSQDPQGISKGAHKPDDCQHTTDALQAEAIRPDGHNVLGLGGYDSGKDTPIETVSGPLDGSIHFFASLGLHVIGHLQCCAYYDRWHLACTRLHSCSHACNQDYQDPSNACAYVQEVASQPQSVHEGNNAKEDGAAEHPAQIEHRNNVDQYANDPSSASWENKGSVINGHANAASSTKIHKERKRRKRLNDRGANQKR